MCVCIYIYKFIHVKEIRTHTQRDMHMHVCIYIYIYIYVFVGSEDACTCVYSGREDIYFPHCSRQILRKHHRLAQSISLKRTALKLPFEPVSHSPLQYPSCRPVRPFRHLQSPKKSPRAAVIGGFGRSTSDFPTKPFGGFLNRKCHCNVDTMPRTAQCARGEEGGSW
jgi:hypothetical protein